jgi:hypothetical protein
VATPPKKSWRDVLPVHPAADLFPTMSDSELRELGNDIKKNGMMTPIVLVEENSKTFLLDGRDRLDAMTLVGIEFEVWRQEKQRFELSSEVMALWKRLFGDWEKFEVTSDLVTLAEQAAEVWNKLAGKLSKAKAGKVAA